MASIQADLGAGPVSKHRLNNHIEVKLVFLCCLNDWLLKQANQLFIC